MPNRDESVSLNSGEIYFNGVCVGVATGIEIGDFTEDRAAVKDYMRNNIVIARTNEGVLAGTLRFNLITYLKLCGLWNWIKTYCPNKRLTYLMDHGKNVRVRLKNYRRAAREIGQYIKEVE